MVEKKRKSILIIAWLVNQQIQKIIGEMIKIGRRGSINFYLEICGLQGHVAYPEKAKNPIDIILKICEKLKEPFDKGSRNFNQPPL